LSAGSIRSEDTHDAEQKNARDVPMRETFRGVVPFLISDAVRVTLLVFFPILSLWLVRMLT